ncbi:MAG TPA: hypothetical protein VGT04_06905 [Acidobacteriaceae bacterium]|nr:hypothetical protein [Acidobacteriaceae bacterium]
MRNEWLLLVTTALSFYGVGNIWLVQLSSYRLFRHVGQREFHAYHVAWWHSVWTAIFIPAGLVFIGSVWMLFWRPPGVPSWALWLGFGLQIVLYGLTAVLWGPLMARLSTAEGGLVLPLYRKLMVNHWLRVAIVTAYGILLFWMVTRSAFSSLAR